MCGIAGYLATRPLDADREALVLRGMLGALAHRGPDDQGIWIDASGGIALGHRRLSILDLSPLGHQPMHSASSRYVISFNGEIYNFAALRDELSARGCSFRGGSDTEVLLAAIETWGIEQALIRAVGMFAIALWDRHAGTLTLARDRLGEKPLYYCVVADTVMFASELRALRQHPRARTDVNRASLALLLKYNFIPAPHTIHERTWKLMPGACATFSVRDHALQHQEQRYWDPAIEVSAAAANPITDPGAAVDAVESALEAAIAGQVVADVPVGAFLSGGIDSSLVVAKMQQRASRPVRTFTIGFADQRFDEAPFAATISRHLGTQHTDLVLTPAEVRSIIPRLPIIYDEPFADSSQMPTFLVSQLARESVTVSLSGDGGDELFSGYDRYGSALARWHNLQRIPAWRRQIGARAVEGMSDAALDWLLKRFARSHRGKGALDSRMRQRARFWRARSIDDVFEELVSFWALPPVRTPGGTWARPGAVDHVRPASLDPVQRLMYADMVRYLPDDILVKVDRAAMAVSLETRVPLLDRDVVRTAWRIPSAVHRLDGRGKWVLRQILARHVPPALFERPKRGFAVPVADWLKVELREWAEALLDPARIGREGYFDAPTIERRWREHLRGDMDWSFHLWGVLMFQAWHEAQLGPAAATPVSGFEAESALATASAASC